MVKHTLKNAAFSAKFLQYTMDTMVSSSDEFTGGRLLNYTQRLYFKCLVRRSQEQKCETTLIDHYVLKVAFDKEHRFSPPELFLRKGVVKICSKFLGEHPYQSTIPIKLQSTFIEIALRHR